MSIIVCDNVKNLRHTKKKKVLRMLRIHVKCCHSFKFKINAQREHNGRFKINEKTILHERLNYPEADGPVAINVEGLEHVVGVGTGVCNSHEEWPLTNYAKMRAVI